MTNVHEKNPTTITTPSNTQIRIERIFDAPRELVWEAYTDAESLPEWLGPRRLTMTIDEMDVRPGGSYRFTHHDADGNEFRFFGEYREIVPQEVLEWTFNFEGMPGTAIDRSEFEDLDGERTKLVVTSTYESKEQRDRMLESGMETGVREGHERLDELLEKRLARQAD